MPDLHMMLDIETMDTSKEASVLSIGACMFDPRGANDYGKRAEDPITDTHYERASLRSNLEAGRTMSADTILWWMQQSEAARFELHSGEQSPLGIALYNFRKWAVARDQVATRIWAKSPDFDCVIMQDAMTKSAEMWPFKFWESRCVRTITELAYPEGDEPPLGIGVAHNALDDSIRQALRVQECYRVLNC
tara:strand:+ start:1108 stop:1680 length:573 start_codon:yes stop_codon:yes gene_type:complete